jgi:hypothetical protein
MTNPYWNDVRRLLRNKRVDMGRAERVIVGLVIDYGERPSEDVSQMADVAADRLYIREVMLPTKDRHISELIAAVGLAADVADADGKVKRGAAYFSLGRDPNKPLLPVTDRAFRVTSSCRIEVDGEEVDVVYL